jgi:hypothetical protein
MAIVVVVMMPSALLFALSSALPFERYSTLAWAPNSALPMRLSAALSLMGPRCAALVAVFFAGSV